MLAKNRNDNRFKFAALRLMNGNRISQIELHNIFPAYPATEQLALGNRLLKIASWIHVQAYDKAAKANVWMPDGVVQPILIG